jgi:hypothetical protein
MPIGPNRNRGRGGHGLKLLDWQFELKRRPGAAATIDGRARGLRQKLNKYLKDEAATRWLYEMANVFLLAMQRAAEPDPEAAEQKILQMAADIGEIDYVREILPILRLTRTEPP